MKEFDFRKEYEKLLTPETVSLLTRLHEYKGRHSAIQDIKK